VHDGGTVPCLVLRRCAGTGPIKQTVLLPAITQVPHPSRCGLRFPCLRAVASAYRSCGQRTGAYSMPVLLRRRKCGRIQAGCDTAVRCYAAPSLPTSPRGVFGTSTLCPSRCLSKPPSPTPLDMTALLYLCQLPSVRCLPHIPSLARRLFWMLCLARASGR